MERTLKPFAITLLLVAIAYPFKLHGQTARFSTLEELAVYNGPDRVSLLVNGAKNEGKVVWYTAMAGGSYKDLARAFEAKYGIAVEAYRGASRDLIAKMLAETQAKKYLVDIVESSPPLLMLMRAMNRLTPFSLPHLAKFAPDACSSIFCSLQKDKKFSRITITAALSKNTVSNDGTSRKACPFNSSNVKAIAGKNC